MAGKSGISSWALALALVAAAPAGALTVPFTEDFASSASSWLNATSAPLTFSATGGPDGSSYVSTTAASINNPGTIQFRGNLSANASGGAFAGNWVSGGVTLLSADVIHDAPTDLTFFFRISAGPAFVGVVPTSVAPNTWTHITLAIDPSNPLLISEGPVSFNTVFSNVLNLQLGVAAPIGEEGVPFTYGLDNVSIAPVPEPTAAGLFAVGLLAFGVRRRRKR